MKIKFLIFVAVFVQSFLYSQELNLVKVKNPVWGPLTGEFLMYLKGLFKLDQFIETGTYIGQTALAASYHFRHVHTIELSPQLYAEARKSLAGRGNVKQYLGNSRDELCKLLAKIKEPVVFWLDAHYSGGGTAKGDENTPALAELECIKKYGNPESVILIDDIRAFFDSNFNPGHDPVLDGYPKIQRVFAKLLEINPNYHCIIFGDTAIAFPKNTGVMPSEFLMACTLSFIDDNQELTPDLLRAEKIIMNAGPRDRELIFSLAGFFKAAAHLHFWKGLMLYKSDKAGAWASFNHAKNMGLSRQNLDQYLMDLAKS